MKYGHTCKYCGAQIVNSRSFLSGGFSCFECKKNRLKVYYEVKIKPKREEINAKRREIRRLKNQKRNEATA